MIIEISAVGTNPTNPDTDSDGIGDKVELREGTNPRNLDTDGDGVKDGAEKRGNEDTDNDGCTDGKDLWAYLGDMKLSVDVDYLKVDDTDGPLDLSDPYVKIISPDAIGKTPLRI